MKMTSYVRSPCVISSFLESLDLKPFRRNRRDSTAFGRVLVDSHILEQLTDNSLANRSLCEYT